MSLRVLAIDPGERVGYATGTIHEERAHTGPAPGVEVNTHGIAHLKDFALQYLRVVHEYDVVVYETWRLRPAMAKKFIGSDFPTVQLVGVIRAGAWQYPHVKLVGQGPDIKATADRTLAAGQHPDIAARIAAAPKVHDEAHDTDALRHLWFHYWKEYV